MNPRRDRSDRGQYDCRVHRREIREELCLASLSEVFAALPSPAILGGNAAKASADGFSYWAGEPREVFEFTAGDGDPFPALELILNRYVLASEYAGGHIVGPPSTPTFCGGWIGYFSYELGRCIERLPGTTIDDLHTPLIRLSFYDRVIAYDHAGGTTWMIVVELPHDHESPEEKLACLERHLERSRRVRVPPPPLAPLEAGGLRDTPGNMSRAEYLRAVRRVKEYIRNGEVYQVNLSQRLELPFAGRPLDLFHWQNRHNPSGYAAYLDTGRFKIVSASPEMFIAMHNGQIRTKPIKGTRPRLAGDEPDASRLNRERFEDLLSSEKERAELNMIVDLERNDLARICQPGTRHVVQPRTIETYPTVYHAVATIGGQLRAGIRFSEILRAMFPGGSITGAPKIRAMEIIEELEPTARGVYTGSIGFLSLNGDVCLNIAIRTVIIASRLALVQVGGGIVADSDPVAEWDETLTKARALLTGIRAVASR